MVRKTISEVERDYLRYRIVQNDDDGTPADASADAVDALGDTFAQETLWKEDGGTSFTDDKREVIVPPSSTAINDSSRLRFRVF